MVELSRLLQRRRISLDEWLSARSISSVDAFKKACGEEDVWVTSEVLEAIERLLTNSGDIVEEQPTTDLVLLSELTVPKDETESVVGTTTLLVKPTSQIKKRKSE